MSSCSLLGVLGLVGVREAWRLRLRMEDLGIDADRGRGAYDLLSFVIGFEDFGVGFGFTAGTSSATSMTEVSVICSALLALDSVGETGSGPTAFIALTVSVQGAVDVDECGYSVTFFQLVLLEAVDEARFAGCAYWTSGT